MSFDEQPDGDPHGECAAEIQSLRLQKAQLAAALRAIVDRDLSYFGGYVLDGLIPMGAIQQGRDVLRIAGTSE